MQIIYFNTTSELKLFFINKFNFIKNVKVINEDTNVIITFFINSPEFLIYIFSNNSSEQKFFDKIDVILTYGMPVNLKYSFDVKYI